MPDLSPQAVQKRRVEAFIRNHTCKEPECKTMRAPGSSRCEAHGKKRDTITS